jgi:hypothetical protein
MSDPVVFVTILSMIVVGVFFLVVSLFEVVLASKDE